MINMRFLWALFVILGVATAQLAWKEGKSYIYDVSGKSTASLEIDDAEKTGIAFKAQLKLFPKSNDEIVAEIRQAKYQPILGGKERTGFKVLETTRENFIIQIKNGVVKGLKVYEGTPEWEINLIRSMVSQLQVDVHHENLLPSQMNSLPDQKNPNEGVFKTMEETVEGNCEVNYDIARLPIYTLSEHHDKKKPQLIIKKSKNFNKCQQLPIFHFGLNDMPNSNVIEDFMSRSSVSQIILTGDLENHNIEFSTTSNLITFTPEIYSKQALQVLSQVNLTLVEIEPHVENVRIPKTLKSIKSLVADYDMAITVQQWEDKQKQLRKEEGISSLLESSEYQEFREWHQKHPEIQERQLFPFNPYSNALQQMVNPSSNKMLRKLIEEISQQMKKPDELPTKNTLNRFTLLVELIRSMSAKELQQATFEHLTEESTKQQPQSNSGWKVFRDAVAHAGTGPALKTIKDWIKGGQVKEEEAAQIIATLPTVAILPNPQYINELFELVKIAEEKKDETLYTSALYSFSKLVRLAQIDRKGANRRYPVIAFGSVTPEKLEAVTQNYIPYLSQQLKDAIKAQDSERIQILIRALGNIGHPQILRVFEPYLENQEIISTFQRSLMVISLNKLSTMHPRLARSVLYKIYINRNEKYQVRVAAVFNLMKTNPPASILQRMAVETRWEQNPHVRAAVKSAIESLAKHSQQELRKNAQAAINLLPLEVSSLENSRFDLKSYMIKELSYGLEQTLQYIGSKDSELPQSIFYELNKEVNGHKKPMWKVGAMLSSIKELEQFLDSWTGSQQMKDSKRESPIDKIEDQIKMSHKWQKELEGNILLNWNSMTRFVTFTNKTSQSLEDSFRKLIFSLTIGQKLNLQKFTQSENTMIAFPNALGLPTVYTMKNPTVVALSGNAKLIYPTWVSEKEETTYGLNVDVQATYSTRYQTRVKIIVPFEQKQYVAGHDKNIHVSLPIRSKFEYDAAKNEWNFKVTPPNEQSNNHRLMHYSTWPYVTSQDILDFKPLAEEPSTRYIALSQPIKYSQSIGEHFGVPLIFELESNKHSASLETLYERFRKLDLISAVVLPVKMGKTNINVFLDTKKAHPISLTGSWRDKRSVSDSQEENSRNLMLNDANSEVRHQEMLRRAQRGLKNAEAISLDFALQVETQKPQEYVATIGLSQNDHESKVSIYWLNRKESGDLEMSYISNQEIHPKAKVMVKFNSNKSTFVANGMFERSQKRAQFVDQLPRNSNTTYQADLMDKYEVKFNFDNISDELKKTTYEIYGLLRHLGYEYLSEDIFNRIQSENEAELKVNYSPDLESVDVELLSPVGQANFRNIRVNQYVRSAIVLHSNQNVLERIIWHATRGYPQCTVSNERAVTLENVTLPVHFGNIWHVLMISTPKLVEDAIYDNTNRFVVIAKDTKRRGLQLEALFESYNNARVEFKPDSEKLSSIVKINGRQIYLKENELYIYVSPSGVKQFSFLLKDNKIFFDSFSYGVKFIYSYKYVTLIPDSMYKDRLGGICGPFNGEPYLISPQNEIITNKGDFMQTWKMIDAEIPRNNLIVSQKQFINYNVVSDQDAGRSDMMDQPINKIDQDLSSSSRESNEAEPFLHKKLMVIERNGKHCFSVTTQPSCKTPNIVIKETANKIAQFVCVEKNNTSERWRILVDHGARPDFRKKGIAQNIEVQVPIACSK